ncbi:hypothetical protein V6N12_045356 [Hibiscus sabdariffa]|uniref:Uncharacterized protein n=1 Tax=Hibiscus sabdariffa TaxID=183260 RepID=A0ABR2G316_9ROSI
MGVSSLCGSEGPAEDEGNSDSFLRVALIEKKKFAMAANDLQEHLRLALPESFVSGGGLRTLSGRLRVFQFKRTITSMPPCMDKFPSEVLEGALSKDIDWHFGDQVPNARGHVICKL